MSGVSQVAQNTQSYGRELFPLWLQIIIYVFIILIALWIFKNIIKDICVALFSKKKNVHATLNVKEVKQYVNKRMFVAQGGGGVNDGIAEKGFDYSLIFGLDDGSIVELIVPKRIYDVSVEGSQGNLVYKGKTFISYDGVTEGTEFQDDIVKNDFVGLNKKF